MLIKTRSPFGKENSSFAAEPGERNYKDRIFYRKAKTCLLRKKAISG